MLLVSTACESSANFYFKLKNIMECKYNKNYDECTNHHNKTKYCKFVNCNQLNYCYYNPNNYQFCKK